MTLALPLETTTGPELLPPEIISKTPRSCRLYSAGFLVVAVVLLLLLLLVAE